MLYRANQRFATCIAPFKAHCWYQEPIKSSFAIAAESLEYACGEGYFSNRFFGLKHLVKTI